MGLDQEDLDFNVTVISTSDLSSARRKSIGKITQLAHLVHGTLAKGVSLFGGP